MAKTTVKKSSGTKARASGSAGAKAKASAAKKAVPARKLVSKSAAIAKSNTKSAVSRNAKKPTTKAKFVAPVRAERPDNSRNAQRTQVTGRPEANRQHVPPIEAVPDVTPGNGKPKKNAAGFSNKDLEHFRELLLAKRREILGDLRSMEHEALRSSGGTNLSTLPIHMADMGTDNYEQEFTLGLVEKDRQLLREINLALAKIQNGTFGICEGTGLPINRERLEYQPWARFSIEYARKMERGGRPGGM